MQKYPKRTGVLRLKNLTRGENGEMGYRNDDITRLYNKNFYTFDYAIHEQICPKDISKRNEPMDAFLLPMDVVHHGYALDDESMKKSNCGIWNCCIRNLKARLTRDMYIFKLDSLSLCWRVCMKQLRLMRRALNL